jgi:hypothetical protein
MTMEIEAIEPDDRRWFTNHTARRFRLRQASAQEAEWIGADNCHVISCKGGGVYVFKTETLPNDSDASLSTFLHQFGCFNRHQRSDAEAFRRRTMAISAR